MNIRELSNYELLNNNKIYLIKDFSNNIYERFVSKIILTDKFKKSLKNFLENKNLNDFLNDDIQSELKNMININIKDEYYKNYVNKIFYDSICEYIIYENKFEEIEKPKKIFMIIVFMSYMNQYKILNYLNNFCEKNNILENKNYEDLQLFINYELIIYYYTLLESYEKIYIQKNNYNTLTELNRIEFNEKIEKYYELIILLYEDGIIKNKLFKNDFDKEDNATFLDIFVHSSYLLENDSSTIVFLKIIIDLVEKLEEEEYIDFSRYFVNTDVLSDLSTHISNKNRELIFEINNSLNENDIYNNSFLYFLNKAYLYRPYQKNNIIFKVNNLSIYDLYRYYFEKIYDIRNINLFHFDEEFFDPCEFVHIIGDTYRTSNNKMINDIINSFEDSKDLNTISKIFMICIWLRYIYYFLNKYDKKPIHYDTVMDKYYIQKNKKKIYVSRETYINDIILFLEKIDEKTRIFLLKNIEYFINHYIYELREEEKKKKDVNCSICFDDFEDPNNLIICTYCKNVFHETCINNAWKNRIDNCPLCRKLISKYFLNYSKVRYNLLKDVYDNYNKYKK